MKHLHVFTVAALAVFLLPVTAGAITYDSALATRMQGRILLQVESHGEAWYVRSKDLKRYYMKDGAAAYSIMRFFSLGIADVDLAKIPQVSNTAEMKTATSACATSSLGNRFRGEILLQVQQHGEAWYVDPVKCRAIYMKDGAVAYEVMRFLGFGVFTRDLEKIQDGGTVTGTGGALSSTPSPFSCPTNSHQNPSGASNCLCDTGYETNSAGNGCVIASTPPASCPTNSHLNPSDSTKCLCDSGYETNSAGNGCAVASTPLPPPPPSCPANSQQDPTDSSQCLCDTGYETNSTGNGCAVAEIFDVKISSLACTLTDIIIGGEISHYYYVRAIVRGTAQGPVGAFVELPILVWPDDVWECGTWTRTNGALIGVGDTCTRKEGQPETTTWSVDTGGDDDQGVGMGETRSYIAKIYSKDPFGDNLLPRKAYQASTVCQY